MTTTFSQPITLAPALPATIAGPGNYTSNPVPVSGSPGIAVGALLSQAGNLTVTRYLDAAGTITLDATTAAISANVAVSVKVVDNCPYNAFSVLISNSSGSTGNLTKTAVLTG